MTIDEAIKELTEVDNSIINRLAPSKILAVRLGIEALKFRQRWEQQEGEDDFPRLPGEEPE
ncbi:hypothetical protein ES703_45975 [subsurface metagenome]